MFMDMVRDILLKFKESSGRHNTVLSEICDAISFGVMNPSDETLSKTCCSTPCNGSGFSI